MIDGLNIKRVEELVNGEMPQGIHEELFVVAFKSGLGGDSFMLTLLQVSDIFNGLTHKDKNYFNLGYALGQKIHLETEDDAFMELNGYNKKTTH
jgi:hypothetical protein